jgi:hypothetical protein
VVVTASRCVLRWPAAVARRYKGKRLNVLCAEYVESGKVKVEMRFARW